jgi:hypothetical protein
MFRYCIQKAHQSPGFVIFNITKDSYLIVLIRTSISDSKDLYAKKYWSKHLSQCSSNNHELLPYLAPDALKYGNASLDSASQVVQWLQVRYSFSHPKSGPITNGLFDEDVSRTAYGPLSMVEGLL